MKEAVAIYQDSLDGHRNVREMFSAGDRVVTHWTGQGTHNAELLGVPPTGNDVSVEAITIMRVADGRIAETWTTWEALALAQQIGAVPAPASAYEPGGGGAAGGGAAVRPCCWRPCA